MKRAVLLIAPLLAIVISCTAMNAGEGEKAMTRQKNTETVRLFFSLLEQEKIREFSELFAEKGKHINPYHSGLFPPEIAGKKNIYAFWEKVPGNFDGMSFPIEAVMPFEKPNQVAVKLKGKIKLKGKAGLYENDYLCLFYFDNRGKILEYHEYFNPLVAARGFGMPDKIK